MFFRYVAVEDDDIIKEVTSLPRTEKNCGLVFVKMKRMKQMKNVNNMVPVKSVPNTHNSISYLMTISVGINFSKTNSVKYTTCAPHARLLALLSILCCLSPLLKQH